MASSNLTRKEKVQILLCALIAVIVGSLVAIKVVDRYVLDADDVSPPNSSPSAI